MAVVKASSPSSRRIGATLCSLLAVARPSLGMKSEGIVVATRFRATLDHGTYGFLPRLILEILAHI